MKTVTLLGMTTLFLALVQARSEDKKTEAKGDAPRLNGTYTIVAGEKFGQKLPEERVKGHTVRFTNDRIIATDKDNKETYVATYELDPGSKPCPITMTSVVPNKGEVARGLIEKDGDTVKLVYALPGGEMPTAFKTRDKQLMFVLKNSGK